MEMTGGWTQRALLKGQIDKGGHYDAEMKEWMEKVGIMMWKLNGRMDKGEHYDMEMKGWM